MHKILIIDDDEVLLRMLSITLAEEGYSVLTTAGGPQGIILCKGYRTALTLVDLSVPHMSGFEVLGENHQFDSKAKMIVIAACSSAESAVGISEILLWPTNGGLISTLMSWPTTRVSFRSF